mmetsp:Transcript_26087/g.61955  ORF Transcript_26087/g.61955 Transcript_26087/m.61955 type:complete len:634 (+) Transcript_26087:1413-3314(+)
MKMGRHLSGRLVREGGGPERRWTGSAKLPLRMSFQLPAEFYEGHSHEVLQRLYTQDDPEPPLHLSAETRRGLEKDALLLLRQTTPCDDKSDYTREEGRSISNEGSSFNGHRREVRVFVKVGDGRVRSDGLLARFLQRDCRSDSGDSSDDERLFESNSFGAPDPCPPDTRSVTDQRYRSDDSSSDSSSGRGCHSYGESNSFCAPDPCPLDTRSVAAQRYRDDSGDSSSDDSSSSSDDSSSGYSGGSSSSSSSSGEETDGEDSLVIQARASKKRVHLAEATNRKSKRLNNSEDKPDAESQDSQDSHSEVRIHFPPQREKEHTLRRRAEKMSDAQRNQLLKDKRRKQEHDFMGRIASQVPYFEGGATSEETFDNEMTVIQYRMLTEGAKTKKHLMLLRIHHQLAAGSGKSTVLEDLGIEPLSSAFMWDFLEKNNLWRTCINFCMSNQFRQDNHHKILSGINTESLMPFTKARGKLVKASDGEGFTDKEAVDDLGVTVNRAGVFASRFGAGCLEGRMQQQYAPFAGIGKNGEILATLKRGSREVEVQCSLINTSLDKAAKESSIRNRGDQLTSVFVAVGNNIIDNNEVEHSAKFCRAEDFSIGRRDFKCVNNEKTQALRDKLKGCVDACVVEEPEWI